MLTCSVRIRTSVDATHLPIILHWTYWPNTTVHSIHIVIYWTTKSTVKPFDEFFKLLGYLNLNKTLKITIKIIGSKILSLILIISESGQSRVDRWYLWHCSHAIAVSFVIITIIIVSVHIWWIA